MLENLYIDVICIKKIKNRTETIVEKLIVNKISDKLWIYLIVDFITKLSLVIEKM